MTSQAQKGFTLAELMIALLVFSFVASIGVYALRLTAEAKAQLTRTQESLQEIQHARTILRNDLMHLIKRPVIDEFGGQQGWFTGGNAHQSGSANSREKLLVSFTRNGWQNPEAMEPRSSLQRITYLVRDDQLIRRVRPYLDAWRGQLQTERILISNLKDIKIEFFDQEVSGRLQWRPDWSTNSSKAINPKAMRLIADTARFGEIELLFWIGSIAP